MKLIDEEKARIRDFILKYSDKNFECKSDYSFIQLDDKIFELKNNKEEDLKRLLISDEFNDYMSKKFNHNNKQFKEKFASMLIHTEVSTVNVLKIINKEENFACSTSSSILNREELLQTATDVKKELNKHSSRKALCH